MKAPLLALKNLTVTVRTDSEEKTVLRDISLTISHGETLALVGESGSGKSLCAQSIMGLLPKPAVNILSGSVELDGKRIDNNPALLHRLRGKRIAMIFQEPITALNPVQTIGEQLAEVFQLHAPDLDAAAIREQSLSLLQAVNITQAEQRLKSFPHQLSGGQCQRVMIAMALAGKPDLLIADEPSTALDASTQLQLLSLLSELQKRYQMAVLFITHDLALVKNWGQRVAVLQQGKLCELADTATLFSSPQHPYTKSLLAAIQPIQSKNNHDDKRIEATLLLEAKNLHKAFRPPQALLARKKSPITVLHNISFTLYEKEIVALVGESGCGKSTLGRALLMLDPADSGDIFYQQQRLNVHDKKQMQQLRREWQVIFQDTNDSLNPRHTIERILLEPFEVHGIGNKSTREQAVRELLQRVELPEDSTHRFPHEFSGGQRQRIGIARAIALNPKFIVCDEAVSALDVSTQAQIIALLLKLKQELSLSLLFITHDLRLVQRIADRVLVMQQGRIVESGETHTLFTQPQHPATHQLLAAQGAE